MFVKLLGGVLAFVLMVAFCAVAAVKLKDVALAAVTLVGLALMTIDLWQSLRSKDD